MSVGPKGSAWESEKNPVIKKAVLNPATAMCSRMSILRTGHRSDMGQTVQVRGEVVLVNGIWFTVLGTCAKNKITSS